MTTKIQKIDGHTFGVIDSENEYMRYAGDVVKNQDGEYVPDGVGVMRTAHGVYYGEVSEGIPNGKGVTIYTDIEIDGYEYTGEHSESRPCGFGRLIVTEGTSYTGVFNDSLFDGRGEIFDKYGPHNAAWNLAYPEPDAPENEIAYLDDFPKNVDKIAMERAITTAKHQAEKAIEAATIAADKTGTPIFWCRPEEYDPYDDDDDDGASD